MTRKEYYYGIAQESCQATVLACKETEGGYEILTDCTVIFPEGGGQPSDTGRIGDCVIRHAREDGGDIWHLGEKPLPVGETLTMHTDMERRMDHSRQHTGEHILSGLASKLYGAQNVGFHLAQDYVTLDLDIFLEQPQLAELEREANRVVMRDIEICYRFVDASALPGMTLRKQAKGLAGEVRIVYIEDTDSCTCCGTHCQRTGEIGSIRITDSMRYKGGMRIWFACGMRAVDFTLSQGASMNVLARRFSVRGEEICEAVIRQGEELMAVKRSLKARTEALIAIRASALLADAERIRSLRLCMLDEPGYGMQELKLLGEKLAEAGDTVALLFGMNGDALCYQLCASKGVQLSMRELCAAVNVAVGGKGGGRDDFAQGSAACRPAGFEETLTQLKRYMQSILRA